MIRSIAPTPRERRRAFARWCTLRSLPWEQGHALLVGLARVGIYLHVEELRLRLMGDTAGAATLHGFLVLHGLDDDAHREEQ